MKRWFLSLLLCAGVFTNGYSAVHDVVHWSDEHVEVCLNQHVGGHGALLSGPASVSLLVTQETNKPVYIDQDWAIAPIHRQPSRGPPSVHS